MCVPASLPALQVVLPGEGCYYFDDSDDALWGGRMAQWLTSSLEEDAKRLSQRVIPDVPNTRAELSERRHLVFLAAVAPDLRLCERRRLLHLSESAPAPELAQLTETLMALERDFEHAWPHLAHLHAKVHEATRTAIRALSSLATQMELVRERRATAHLVLAAEVETEASEQGGVPTWTYRGYETDLILEVLRRRAQDPSG